MRLVPDAPEPRFVMSEDGTRIATYEFGGVSTSSRVSTSSPTVLAVHGFASSATANWQATGWVRELTRAGYRVLAIDQRGHGQSGKPHDPAMYSMELLVADVATVIDDFLLDDITFVGYSLGGRVGWHASLALPNHITRAVLGGIPDGLPLTKFRLDQARAFIASAAPIDDPLTNAYVTMASGIAGNDLTALVSLVEGMQSGVEPDPANPPQQAVLFATGSEDGILAKSRALASATPRGEFYEIPGRNHFNAPTSKHFRDRALQFLAHTAG